MCFQTLFVTTGCDYVSFFNGMGRATFLRYFYQFAEFITSGRGNTPGTLADISLDDGQLDTDFLSFLRLIGAVTKVIFCTSCIGLNCYAVQRGNISKSFHRPSVARLTNCFLLVPYYHFLLRR